MYQYTNRDIVESIYNTGSEVSCEQQDNPSNKYSTSDVTLREFFDFLSSACKAVLDLEDKHYKDLLNNEFVTKLLEICVDKFKLNIELNDGSNVSEVYSLNCERVQESTTFCSSKEEEKQNQGIRSLLIRINRKNDDQNFYFSHLPIFEAENILKHKVEAVINEGVMDSIFPFFISKFSVYLNSKNVGPFALPAESHKTGKQSVKQRTKKSQDSEAEIEIQVCDEVNNVSKNFKCSQSLLLSKMEYFAEVTEVGNGMRGENGKKCLGRGEYWTTFKEISGKAYNRDFGRLEDMDISVHCDVAIFEWLMKWVHKPLKGTRPVLNISNVTPILISAMFLRMEPLVDESVQFFKNNIKEIIETTTSLSCLNDNILEKIADTLTNVELDSLNDPTDKIQSKLFTKFIISLGKRKIDKRKGHFSSLASLYRCFYCKQILHEEHGQTVPCIPDLLAVDSHGNIKGRHKEDTSWNLNSYMKQLKRELNSWQNVYWKLWGTCHYMQCVKCKVNYPIVSSMNCRYHPNGAHFGVRSDSSNLLIPVGNYVCCGAKTYRFDVLGLPNGCMIKSHVPLENENSIKLLSILESKRRIICDSDQVLCAQEKKHEEVKEMYGTMVGCSSTWRPLSRGNYIDKVYSFNDILNAIDERESDADIDYDGNCTRSTIEDMDNASSDSEFNDIASIGDGEDSDGSSSSKKYSPQNKSENNVKLWTIHRSIRFNQDNQREREEKIIKCIINKLNRSKNDSEFDIFLANNGDDPYHTSDGGVYAFLEDEWREESVQQDMSNPCFTPSRSPKPRTTKYTYSQ